MTVSITGKKYWKPLQLDKNETENRQYVLQEYNKDNNKHKYRVHVVVLPVVGFAVPHPIHLPYIV